MDMMGSMMQAAGAVVGAAGTVSTQDTRDHVTKGLIRYTRLAAEEEANLATRGAMGERASGIALKGGSGVALDKGSNLMVDDAIVQEIALNRARIKHGGEVEAHRLRTENTLAKQASRIQMHTSLISGGAAAFQGLTNAGYFGGSKTGSSTGSK